VCIYIYIYIYTRLCIVLDLAEYTISPLPPRFLNKRVLSQSSARGPHARMPLCFCLPRVLCLAVAGGGGLCWVREPSFYPNTAWFRHRPKTHYSNPARSRGSSWLCLRGADRQTHNSPQDLFSRNNCALSRNTVTLDSDSYQAELSWFLCMSLYILCLCLALKSIVPDSDGRCKWGVRQIIDHWKGLSRCLQLSWLQLLCPLGVKLMARETVRDRERGQPTGGLLTTA